MSVPILPANAVLLYSDHLDPDTFTLVGSIPNKYPNGISVYVENADPYNTVMTQVVITRHQTANAANLFNKTMYIPARNVANLTNFSNIAGLNVFAKTSGMYTTVYIVYNPESANGNQIINVTPNVINQDQTITPMPAPQMSTSNSIGTQLLALSGQVSQLNNQVAQLQNTMTDLNTQILFLKTQLNTITSN